MSLYDVCCILFGNSSQKLCQLLLWQCLTAWCDAKPFTGVSVGLQPQHSWLSIQTLNTFLFPLLWPTVQQSTIPHFVDEILLSLKPTYINHWCFLSFFGYHLKINRCNWKSYHNRLFSPWDPQFSWVIDDFPLPHLITRGCSWWKSSMELSVAMENYQRDEITLKFPLPEGEFHPFLRWKRRHSMDPQHPPRTGRLWAAPLLMCSTRPCERVSNGSNSCSRWAVVGCGGRWQ